MNILGIGVPELIIIFVLLLVVAGPKRMVAWAYIAGRELAKLRAMWSETMGMIQRELQEAGFEEAKELGKLKDFRKFNLTEEVRKVIEAPEPPTKPDDKPKPLKPSGADGAPKVSVSPKPPAGAAPHPEARAVDAESAITAAETVRPAAPETDDNTQASAGH